MSSSAADRDDQTKDDPPPRGSAAAAAAAVLDLVRQNTVEKFEEGARVARRIVSAAEARVAEQVSKDPGAREGDREDIREDIIREDPQTNGGSAGTVPAESEAGAPSAAGTAEAAPSAVDDEDDATLLPSPPPGADDGVDKGDGVLDKGDGVDKNADDADEPPSLSKNVSFLERLAGSISLEPQGPPGDSPEPPFQTSPDDAEVVDHAPEDSAPAGGSSPPGGRVTQWGGDGAQWDWDGTQSEPIPHPYSYGSEFDPNSGQWSSMLDDLNLDVWSDPELERTVFTEKINQIESAKRDGKTKFVQAGGRRRLFRARGGDMGWHKKTRSVQDFEQMDKETDAYLRHVFYPKIFVAFFYF